jgi:ferredoxin
MAMRITDECVCCSYCTSACPVGAITQKNEEMYEIDPDKCVECQGYRESPGCAEVCSVGCIVKA